jgi:hypothetical protein
MNPNLTQVSKPTQWKAGVSGNPNGRRVGTRQAFSAAFYRDLAEVWAAVVGWIVTPNDTGGREEVVWST